METLKNLLLYNGLTKEHYYLVRPMASAENKRMVNSYSLFAFIVFASVAAYTLIKDMSFSVFVIRLIPAALFIAIHFMNKYLSEKYPIISNIFAVLFELILLGAGAYIGLSQPEERTTLLLPFFVFVPLAFSFRIIYLVIILFSTEIAYLSVAYLTQPHDIFTVNMINTIIFFAVGLYTGHYVMKLKYHDYEKAQINQLLIYTDSLTSLYNRRSFEDEISRVKSEKIPVTVFSIDINGLKQCNDTKGHIAGDELIIGTAECLKKTFYENSKVFRTGGDEFIVFDYDPSCNAELLLKKLISAACSWHGQYVDGISLSCGISKADDLTNIDDAIQTADMQMYNEKRIFHMGSC